MKYVLVSGGGLSGIGKGIIASSTGLLLKTLGLKVTAVKIDPYLNIDAGTMAPTEHGEVYTLDDGGEVDLDLGNYERYLNITLGRDNNITTGKLYQQVIEKERKGAYLGQTVQIVPHLTDALQDWIERVAKVPVDDSKEAPDVCIIELGGTVGDIESQPYIQALSQLRRRAGRGSFLHIHTTFVPLINGEQKTKLVQQAIKEVRKEGLYPDLIACRCETPLSKATIDKIAMYCQLESENAVIAVHNLPLTYRVPVHLEEQGLVPLLKSILQLDSLKVTPEQQKKGKALWTKWKDVTGSNIHPPASVKIALVGKYISLHDSYLSVIKSLEHASMECGRRLEILWIDASLLEPEAMANKPAEFYKAWHEVSSADGVLVPGGFGSRGTEGMIAAAKYCRENKKPYLGVCLGMQLAVIEYARHVCGLTTAGSEEMDESAPDRVIIFMPEVDKTTMGATMRLGSRETHFQIGSEWSKLRSLYTNSMSKRVFINGHRGSTSSSPPLSATTDHKAPIILERHRHRYEVNPQYIERLAAQGLSFVGKDDKGERMEIIELKDHPWFVGVQFHPEYLSRVLEPSKPYLGLVAAAAGCLDEVLAKAKGSKVLGMVNGDSEEVLVNGTKDLVI